MDAPLTPAECFIGVKSIFRAYFRRRNEDVFVPQTVSQALNPNSVGLFSRSVLLQRRDVAGAVERGGFARLSARSERRRGSWRDNHRAKHCHE